ncbi:MAG: hypothetical protein ACR2OX_09550 [Methyloligellaceae bacterium]
MSSSHGLFRSRLVILAILFCAATSAPVTVSAGKLLDFENIQGKWTGFGWFMFGAAARQRARCQAVIRANGAPNQGSLDLNCTSEGLDIKGKAFDIKIKNGAASGKWTLTSHEIDGTLKGSVTENSLSMRLKPLMDKERNYGAEFSTILQDKCRASIKVSVDSPIDLKKIDLSVRRC